MVGKGPLWQFFYQGAKQNQTQYRAHCLACIDAKRPEGAAIDVDLDALLIAAQPWFNDALQASAETGSVRGEASAMISHLIKCRNAGEEAKKVAQREKMQHAAVKKAKRNQTAADEGEADEEDSRPEGSQPKKRKRLDETKANLKQSTLQVFSGLNIPFSAQQKPIVAAQFLRATVSANLPFRWVDDPEIIKLLLMFRATADDVIPDRRVLSGRLLNDAAALVEENIRVAVRGKYVTQSTDGWKDKGRNSVTGVNIARRGKAYLVKLIKTNKQKKDGESYCELFLSIIDETEEETGCIVVLFCTDNDGGSHKGRDLMPLKRAWLLVAPCCAHQFQLMLGDYFKENDEAAAFAEQATALIGWLINHQKVRAIIDDVQLSKNGAVLVILIANLTRWTTHFLAFDRLVLLKPVLRHAAIIFHTEIVKAQVGAETRRKERERLTAAAKEQLAVMEDSKFWDGLETVVRDIEPICYGTNINQSDHTRLDEVTLSFAGIFRHFDAHLNRRVAAGMKKRIEKRWKALDQPIFVFALILNPYEGLSRFGDKAGINVFSLNTSFIELYKRIKSRPDNSMSADELATLRAQREKQVSASFMAYLASTGPFNDFKQHQETFAETHGRDPLIVWEAFRAHAEHQELADFAIMLLELIVNQAGMERSFSDLKVKQTDRRNRLGLPKLEKLSKVGADIRTEHVATGLVNKRAKRDIHDEDRVKALLEVPQYADLLDGINDSDSDVDTQAAPRRVIVRTKQDWRKEMRKWMEEERADSDDDEPDDAGLNQAPGRTRKWLPASLAVLFGGKAAAPVDVPEMRPRRRPALDHEARMMELLAAEHSGEEPDDGALEGSGDDFEE